MNVAVPGPVKEEGPEIAIHASLLLTVHGQSGPVVTVAETAPPVVGTVCACGEALYAQAADADWVTLYRIPAAVIAPVRGAPVVAATSNWTGAVPLPVVPDRRVIQGESDETVHPHS